MEWWRRCWVVKRGRNFSGNNWLHRKVAVDQMDFQNFWKRYHEESTCVIKLSFSQKKVSTVSRTSLIHLLPCPSHPILFIGKRRKRNRRREVEYWKKREEEKESIERREREREKRGRMVNQKWRHDSFLPSSSIISSSFLSSFFQCVEKGEVHIQEATIHISTILMKWIHASSSIHYVYKFKNFNLQLRKLKKILKLGPFLTLNRNEYLPLSISPFLPVFPPVGTKESLFMRIKQRERERKRERTRKKRFNWPFIVHQDQTEQKVSKHHLKASLISTQKIRKKKFWTWITWSCNLFSNLPIFNTVLMNKD